MARYMIKLQMVFCLGPLDLSVLDISKVSPDVMAVVADQYIRVVQKGLPPGATVKRIGGLELVPMAVKGD